jgi:putative Holliday junction resolvase
MRAIGVDLGTKRIGVALSSGSLATPYDVVERCGNRRRDHARIGALAAEADAEVIVVGLPLSMDGSVGPAAQRAIDEAGELAEVVDVAVETWDERLSTVSAERALVEQDLGAKARRRVVDKVAAAIILQSWLDARRHHNEEKS